MPRTTLHVVAASWLWCVLAILLLARIVEVVVERGVVSWNNFFFALRRRLDDPSWWAVLACLLAAILLTRGHAAAERYVGRRLVQRFRVRSFVILWLVPAVLLSTVYTAYVIGQGETLAHPGPDPVKIVLQRQEGMLVLSGIWTACFLFASAMRLLHEIRDTLVAHRNSGGLTLGNRLALVDAARLALSAGAGPAIAASLGWLVYGLFAWTSHVLGWDDGRPTWVGTADAVKLVLGLVLYYLPFFVVAGYGMYLLDGRDKLIDFGKLKPEKMPRTLWLRSIGTFGPFFYKRFWRRVQRIRKGVSKAMLLISIVPAKPLQAFFSFVVPLVASWEPIDGEER